MKTKFNNLNLANINLSTSPGDANFIIPKNFNNADKFFCVDCFKTYEQEKTFATSGTFNNEVIDEEEERQNELDINPSMEEEKFCISCMKRNIPTQAMCLMNGEPSCSECAVKKRVLSNLPEDVNNINQINSFFIDNPVINSASENAMKEKALKRMRTLTTLTSTSSEKRRVLGINNNLGQSGSVASFHHQSVDMTSASSSKNNQNSDISKTLMRNKTKYNINLNIDSIEEVDKESMNNSRLPEVSYREIDHKIMNLVSPRTTVDLKYRKSTKSQIERVCKSLEVIFENSQKVHINLPKIFEGSKDDSKMFDKELLQKFTNGNFLFLFLDTNKEFLFGIVMNVFSHKMNCKIFKKFGYNEENIPEKGKPAIEYLSDIFDQISITKNYIIIESILKFNLSTYKFLVEDGKVFKFFIYGKNKSLCNQIAHLNIYDMC